MLPYIIGIYFYLADTNSDDQINILDIINIVNIILDN